MPKVVLYSMHQYTMIMNMHKIMQLLVLLVFVSNVRLDPMALVGYIGKFFTITQKIAVNS